MGLYDLPKEDVMRTVICAIILAVPCLADEVILKDGRRIEWSKLEDSGDSYIIITPENTRIVVKRAEVESFAKTEHAVLLTGATMTFDKKAKLDVIDLLKSIDSARDVLSGAWKFLPDGSIQCSRPPQVSGSRIQARYALASEEYNLIATVERVEDGDNICFGLPTPGGNQCTFFFDLGNGQDSALLMPDQKKLGLIQGKQFPPKKQRTVTFMVRKGGLVVQLDGKDFTTIRTDWSKVQPYPDHGPREQGFSFAGLTTGVKLSRMVLSYPAGQK
jgi:hypothetical protein